MFAIRQALIELQYKQTAPIGSQQAHLIVRDFSRSPPKDSYMIRSDYEYNLALPYTCISV